MSTGELKQVEVSQLTQVYNYRQEYDWDYIRELSQDMQENSFRMEEPILAYAENESLIMIDGHTRYQAALLASLYRLSDHQPTFQVWVLITPKPANLAEFIRKSIRRNENRREPDDISKGIAYQTALAAGATLEQLCRDTSHTADYINRRLELLKLDTPIRKAVADGQLTIGYAVELAKLDMNRQHMALNELNTRHLTFEAFKAVVDRFFQDQHQCKLEDLPMFGGQAIACVVEAVLEQVEQRKTRLALERENEALKLMLENERRARQAEREAVRKLYWELKTKLASLEGVAA